MRKAICAFAEEVYRFCPDTVDQGTAVEGSAAGDWDAARRLCPEISPETREWIRQRASGSGDPKDHPWLLRMMLRFGHGFFTGPPERGIRLLALQLQVSKGLWLWWD